jgi:hypothetical protein
VIANGAHLDRTTQLPPLPNGCDSIVPRSVPLPVEVAFGEAPIGSVIDDTGEGFLFTTAPDGVGTLSRTTSYGSETTPRRRSRPGP